MKPFIASFDSTISHWVQQLPPGLYGLMYSVSFIGQPLITIAVGVIIGIAAAATHHYRLVVASFVALATFGANSVLKELFHRSRPATDYARDMILETYSFPSGHAASSVAIFGLLAYIAWHTLPQPLAGITTGLLVLLILLIGISRIYLGAHYASDVVVGWLVGLVGLVIIVVVVRPLV